MKLGCALPRLLVVAVLVLGVCLVPACRARRVVADDGRSTEDQVLREQLVSELAGEIRDARVLAAMRRVPRHLFVPGAPLPQAYANSALPIEHGQTISQPQVVAKMTEALSLRGAERVLEIGTGSGYQAAVLSVLARKVYSIEIVPELGETARTRLATLGYANVQVLIGDGYKGWPKEAPFDRILITAAPPEVPAALFAQLAVGGILVAPVGKSPLAGQRLLRYTKTETGVTAEELGLVSFVPMVPGDAGRP
jgi:protein-L-isoaspartate(D-aspartate) O-methyltransferase